MKPIYLLAISCALCACSAPQSELHLTTHIAALSPAAATDVASKAREDSGCANDSPSFKANAEARKLRVEEPIIALHGRAKAEDKLELVAKRDLSVKHPVRKPTADPRAVAVQVAYLKELAILRKTLPTKDVELAAFKLKQEMYESFRAPVNTKRSVPTG